MWCDVIWFDWLPKLHKLWSCREQFKLLGSPNHLLRYRLILLSKPSTADSVNSYTSTHSQFGKWASALWLHRPACSRRRRKGQRDSAPGDNLFLQMVSLQCGSPRGEPQIKVVIIICDKVPDVAWDMGPFQCPFHQVEGGMEPDALARSRQSTARSHFPSWASVINSVTTPLSWHCCT